MLVAFKMILMRPVCKFTFLEQGSTHEGFMCTPHKCGWIATWQPYINSARKNVLTHSNNRQNKYRASIARIWLTAQHGEMQVLQQPQVPVHAGGCPSSFVGRSWWAPSWTRAGNTPLMPMRITVSRAACCQQVEGVDSAPPLSTGKAEPVKLPSTREIQRYWREFNRRSLRY